MASLDNQCQRSSQDSYAIILPAGFGKTEYIANYASKQQRSTLILTHTNAGVFALRKRLAARGVSNGSHVLTIAAWCELWVSAYPDITHYASYCESKEHDPDAYFKRLYEGMLFLSAKSWFRKTMQASYGSVVVDEYQDCTKGQHALFLHIMAFMKLVVLGDPLQGIFYWVKGDSPVDWNQLSIPVRKYDSKPWRWINVGRPDLGQYISDIRTDLLPVLEGHPAEASLDKGCPSVSIVSPEKLGRIQHWENCGTVAYITSVKNIQYAFSKRHVRFQANEPIDNKEAENVCLSFDQNTGATLALAMLDFASSCFTHTTQELKSYRSNLEKGSFDFRRIKKHPEVGQALEQISIDTSYCSIMGVLDAIRNDNSFRLYRGILYNEVYRALRKAAVEGLNASEALKTTRAQHRSFEEYTPTVCCLPEPSYLRALSTTQQSWMLWASRTPGISMSRSHAANDYSSSLVRQMFSPFRLLTVKTELPLKKRRHASIGAAYLHLWHPPRMCPCLLGAGIFHARLMRKDVPHGR